MVLEEQLLPFLDWLLRGGDGQYFGALPRFFLAVGGVGLFGLIVGYLIAAARRGLLAGGDFTYRTVADGFGELIQSSPRRVWAIARLAMKEAWRRRVIIALAVFAIFLLFASWFLRTDMQHPARLYMSVVLFAMTLLVLGVSVLLGSFSLPADFKSKTIYTVVTKPVRAGEIVLGRIIGFTIIATALLAIMGLASYVFVVRQLYHVHQVDVESLVNVKDSSGKLVRRQGRTVPDPRVGHDHDVEIDENGTGMARVQFDHTHDVTEKGGDILVSGPIGYVRARSPHYGKLRFIDRSGADKDKGISVGNEWAYRSFIDGNTPATAIWVFDNLSEKSAFKNDAGEEYLPLSLMVRVFRTHKGRIGRPLAGTIQFRNPETKLASDPLPFDALDQQVAEFDIKRKLTSPTGQEIDLFDDLVDDKGRLEVLVKCLEGGQYFGFAQADCYVRLPDGNPIASYVKVLASIWVQAVIVIAVGVTISTLVSGPIALLFTLGFIILGFYRPFFLKVATGTNYGGGPAESIVRIANQANEVTKLEASPLTTIVTNVDYFLLRPFMWCVAQVLPDFNSLSTADYAAEGYNVPWDRVAQDLATGLGFVVGLTLLGFFLLRTREVAR